MSRWSSEMTVKFVTAYAGQECLWNVNSPLYKNKTAKAAAIEELEKLMGIPGFQGKEIKQKIKNIRCTYTQELKKVKDSQSSNTVYVPNVKWFTILDECLRTLDTTRSESILVYEDNTDELTEDSAISSNATEVDYSSPTVEYKSDFRQPKPVNRNRKRKHCDLKAMVCELKEMTGTANTLSGESEFDVFGKHVALQLKSLPLLLALEAQEHIQMFLNSFRRQHIMQNTALENRTGTTAHTLMGSPLSSTSSDDSYNLQSS